jgi:hypothetical protein
MPTISDCGIWQAHYDKLLYKDQAYLTTQKGANGITSATMGQEL